jgi:CBS domain-containing protein
MLVSEVMTTDVVRVPESTTLMAAAALLAAHRITGVPVLAASGALVGVISEADLLRELVRPNSPADESNLRRVGQTTVSAVMRRHPITVAPDTDVDTATDLMTCTAIKSLPVVQGDRVVGVISRSDILRGRAQPTSGSQGP